MKRFRLSTLMLLIVIAALVTALIVQGRRIAELEAVAGPTLANRRMVARKWNAEIKFERLWGRANELKSSEGKDR
jgi:hypothetical protein